MNKEKIKKLVKKLILESINFDETYDGYEIEADNIAIPGIVDSGEAVIIGVNINYNISSGHEERGQFSGPDHAVQGEVTSIEIVNAVPITLNIHGRELIIKTLMPVQIQPIKDYVSHYLSENESEIEEKIINSTGI